MTSFQTDLAQRFADLSNITLAARPTASFASQLASSDLSSLIRQPIDTGIFNPTPVATPPVATPLTPIDASNFIGTVAQTPQQIITAAVHAARVAFEAVPVAQDGDEIDAAIPNAFRSAMISLLSLAEGAITQLYRRPGPVRLPPIFVPPVSTTPPGNTGIVPPPLQIDPGIIHINPGVLTAANPALTQPAGGGGDPAAPVATPQSTLPLLNLGGQVFQPVTAIHPETGVSTTVLAPVSTSGLVANLAPVSGGGFHVTLDNPATPAAVAAVGNVTPPQLNLGGLLG